MTRYKLVPAMLLSLTLILLPSCSSWFGGGKDGSSCTSCQPVEAVADHSDGSAVLLKIGGKPVLTAKEFEDFIEKSSEGNEQVRMLMQFMPDFKEQVFNAKKKALIISEWAKRNNVHSSPEYKAREKLIMDSIRESLDAEEFLKRHDVEVTDADAKKFYDENKDKDPRIVISTAGTNAVGVSFATQAAANEFADLLKKEGTKNIEKLAKDKKAKVTPFGTVNEESVIDTKVKEKILAAKKFPEVIVVKGQDNKFWVVVAKSKEKAQYRPFDQVKDVIKKMLKPKKVEEMIEKEMPKLETEYGVTEDKEYFAASKKKAEQEAEQAAKAMAESMKAQQEPGSESKPATPQAPPVSKAA